MDPTPARSGVRLSTLALVGIILLSVLLGCLLGTMLGGAGGFLTARSMASSAQSGLQQQVDDLQRQLRDAQNRQPTAAPSAGRTPTAPASGAPAAPSARPGQGSPTARATAPGGGQGAPTGRATQAPGGSGGQTPPVYLGVRYIMLNPDIAAQLGITNTQGAAISEVIPDSPAQKAGLEAGDIITAMDGRELNDSFTLADGVVTKKPGDTVEFTVLRDDRTVKITATLAAPPAGAFNTPTPGGGAPARPLATATPGTRPTGGATAAPPRGTAAPAATPSATRPAGTARPGASGPATSQPTTNTAPSQRPYLGVQVSPVTDEVAKARGLKQTAGAVIEQVIPASPAYQAGLFDGDIILAVEGTAVDATHSLTSLLTARKPGDKVKLRVVRNGKEEDLTVTLGATTSDFNEGRPGGP